MFDQTHTVFCDGCGAEIGWLPILHAGSQYCCQDCAEDRPCSCGMQAEWEDDRRKLQTAGIEAL